MASLAARSSEPELMDGADVTAEEFAACLASLSRVNTLTRARPPTLRFLEAASAGLPRGAALSVVDVGFGEGDMLRAIARWGARRGLDLSLTGWDLNPRSAPIAAARTDPDLPIVFRTGDALQDPQPVDVVISSLTTHHMSDAEIVRFLVWMERVARRGWFVNDLHRRWLAWRGFAIIAALGRFHPFVRHDGPVSIARSFRTQDWRRLLAAAGLDGAGVQVTRRFPYRLCVSRLR
ncbi:MAG TPA: methyltransferase domain-containing protein [Caulobacteraceae bacterium]|jgi:SAM-dependent methyltransferase|nr:methyltransferase domain-containing protein [Caulobacteraceae bacterium]